MVRDVFLNDGSYEKLREQGMDVPTDSDAGAKGLVARDKVGEAFFGRFAGREATERLRNRIFWMAGQLSGNRVLDIGTSEGVLPVLAAREGFEVTGIDVNAQAISYARTLADAETEDVRRRIDLRVADLVTYTDEAEPFDTVTAGEVIEHQIAPRRFFEACHQALVPGGRFVVTTPFGVSPDPDHKISIFPSDIAAFAEGLFEIDALEAQDGYLRFVGTKARDAASAPPGALLSIAEEGGYHSQKHLFAQIDAMQARAKILSADAERQRTNAEGYAGRLRAAQAELTARTRELEDAVNAAAGAEALAQERLDEIGRLKVAYDEAEEAANAALSEAEAKAEKTALAAADAKADAESDAFLLRSARDDLRDAREAETALAARVRALEASLTDAREQALVSNKRLKAYRRSAEGVQAYARALRGSTAVRMGLKAATLARRPHRVASDAVQRVSSRAVPQSDPTKLSAPPRSMRVPSPEDVEVPEAARPCPSVGGPSIQRMARGGAFASSDLRIGLVADEFTRLNFAATCRVRHLTPSGWPRELADFPVDLVFLESAWRGFDDTWHRKLQKVPPELTALIAASRSAGVPVVFWNKEDPVHTKAWLPLAREADYVFTSDAECVPSYVAAIGHDRVGVLPFGCAPKLTNPIADVPRRQGTSFAGSYYRRYPDRTVDLDMLTGLARERGSLTIYDRNSDNDYADFAFPERFAPYLAPTLPFERISEAYKGYEVGINMNSVRQSPTMFARRAFELMASGTIVLSNYSFGMRLMLGDLVISGEDAAPIKRRLSDLDRPGEADRLRTRALRAVLSAHTYDHRLGAVARAVGLRAVPPSPMVTVVASARTVDEALRIGAAFARQDYARKRLLIVLTGEAADCGPGALALPEGTAIISDGAGEAAWHAAVGAAPTDLVAVLSPSRAYGPAHIGDLALSRTYYEGDGATRDARREPYTEQASAVPSRSIVTAGYAAEAGLARLLSDDPVEGAFLNIDRFNVSDDADAEGTALDAEPYAFEGVPISRLDEAAARLRARAARAEPDLLAFDPAALAKGFGPADREPVTFARTPRGAFFESRLPEERHAYAYMTKTFGIDQLRGSSTDQVTMRLDVEGGLQVKAVLAFFDPAGGRLAPALPPAGAVRRVVVPDGAATVRVGVRMQGPGRATLTGLRFGTSADSEIAWVPKARTLVLTQAYPGYDDIYRNGFVHRRVKAYEDEGLVCDVLRFDVRSPVSRYEFDGVDVTVGHEAELEAALSSGTYADILVHFLEPRMWAVLKPHLGQVRLTVWLHGSEVQPWHRREFNYADGAARERAMKLSAPREAMWADVFATRHPGLRFVFVADYARREVEEDYAVKIPSARRSVIHNVIDTDLFAYVPKPSEQRFKILSIRPFASAKYANDVTVEAIRLLSERGGFHRYAFRLIGDGKLFDATVAPMRGLPNVNVERGFLTQTEIAEMHRDYGIWLSPTRMDWQGVSRDEAMSSGLVPVTTDCTAIPEFVDATCGVLCPLDDPKAVADAIERLADDAALFERMSKAAADRVRAQSGLEQTTRREVALIRRGAQSASVPK